MKTTCTLITIAIITWVATTIVNGMATISNHKFNPANAMLAK